MRLKLSLLCLLGGWLVLCSSAPANIESDKSSVQINESAAIDAAEVSDLADVELAKEPSSSDDNPGDEPKDSKTPTSLERAKAALAGSSAPALSNHEICTTLIAVAQANELPVGFFTNLIWRESQFDIAAISRVGAMGIAQFMPDVADKLGLDAFDARDALPASGRLLRTLRARFGNLGLVAAAYNAGPKRVSDWLQQRSGLPRETRDYVSLITGRTAEQWREVKSKAVVFNVPRQVPCHRTAGFSEIEQAERLAQLQKIAEEKKIAEENKLREKTRVTLRRPGKNKTRGTISAGGGRPGCVSASCKRMESRSGKGASAS
jgi:hypothetical protein